MRKFTLCLSALVCALCLPAAAHADASFCDSVAGNLVQNCGFETGDFSNWTVAGNTQGGIGGNFIYIDNYYVSSGNYAAAFGAQSTYGQTGAGDTYGPVTTLSQSLAVQPGTVYEIFFGIDNEGCSVSDGCPGYYNTFGLSFDGQNLFSEDNFPNTGGYAYGVFLGYGSFQSAMNNGIQFSFSNDSGNFYLDDVLVVPIGNYTPEPSSLVLLGTGMAGLFGVAKRRFSRS